MISQKAKLSMGKSNYFSTKSVFVPLLSLVNDKTISDASKKHDSDCYVNHFKSKDHFINHYRPTKIE